ncbi:hypothetical protein C2G38_638121 [Gigaspora rosea]|uniref:Uncharacterized protein n=1 Tax=Gigaspora rosea TaxID=44941 RepID=A0A397VTG9_9GLOM|nr:hypothetical protein C2G38_638121 [Gigaspora rosea]
MHCSYSTSTQTCVFCSFFSLLFFLISNSYTIPFLKSSMDVHTYFNLYLHLIYALFIPIYEHAYSFFFS